MNKFLKNALLAISLTAFAGVASATCVQGCPTTNPPPAPTPSSFEFTVGGGSLFSGMAGAVYEGSEGFAKVEKEGYGFTETTLNVGGDLCGVDCQDGSFTFKGAAGESVKAMSGAFTTQSGTAATAINQGQALSGVKFNFSKVTQ